MAIHGSKKKTVKKSTHRTKKASTSKAGAKRAKSTQAVTHRKVAQPRKAKTKSVVKHKTSAVSHRKLLKSARTHTSTSVFAPTPHTRTSSKKRIRPWLHLESSRRVAYYGMGTMALVGGLTFLLAQSYREPMPPSAGSTLKTEATSAFEYVPEKTVEVAHAGNHFTLAKEFKEAQDLRFEKRMGYWSAFIEKSQHNRTRLLELAQGRQIEDTAPIIPKLFDCTTFVETVAALSRSDKPEDFFDNLMAIRYKDSRPTYLTRNHFPEADWIPNNQKAEILFDITSRVAESGGLTAKVETKTIDRSNWLKVQIAKNKSLRSIASLKNEEWPSTTDAQISYIAVHEVDNVLSDIPNGSIVNLVHKNDNAHPVLITHQGIIIRNGNQVLIRHSTATGKIRTTDFQDYLKRLAKAGQRNPNWPLIGVNFNQVRSSQEARGYKESKDSSSPTKRRSASI